MNEQSVVMEQAVVEQARELIVAVATPPGQGGVGIVRLSGLGAHQVAQNIVGRELPVREAIFTRFQDDDEIIDEGLVLAFAGPNSFTGEDVVELQCHGSPVVLQRLMDVARKHGARIARPGEFSERAFLNGKIDLAQAEAVADLIASGSVQAARAAVRSLQGVFSEKVTDIAGQLEHTRILLEASIDFPEEEEDFLAAYDIGGKVAAGRDAVTDLLNESRRGQVYRDGCSVALIGQPNAGKSSLLNAFTGQDTAIVTDIPGTTRDLLKVDLVLQGLPVRIVDTAGLRTTTDVVEQQGVQRALGQIEAADVVLLILDLGASESIEQQLQTTLSLAAIDAHDERLILVRNKADLMREPGKDDLGFAVSAQTGAGIEQLTDAICSSAGVGMGEVLFTARARHVEALVEAQSHLSQAAQAIKVGTTGEVIAEELHLAHQAMGEIVGQVTADELLGKIFSQFCIGK